MIDWVFRRHSFDVISAESAVRMFKENAYERSGMDCGSVAVGLTDRREYNGFVPLMDEDDPLKTAVLRIFSGLQVRIPPHRVFPTCSVCSSTHALPLYTKYVVKSCWRQ